MSTPAALEWITCLNKYVSTCHTGGTPEQREWAWARANTALDTLMLHELAELRHRAKQRRVEDEPAAVPAIPFPGRSI